MTTIRKHLDVLLGFVGVTTVIAAVTIIFGWPYGLLLFGVSIVAIALVVPTWV